MGRILTFYSYKGGTGRSMALANVAWILASNGRRVLAIDWDLEAPGLHRYFRPFLADPDITSSKGVIDFVIDFATLAMTPPEPSETSAPDWYLKHADLVKYAVSLQWTFPDKGTIDFVPAGRQGPSYAKRVNSFSWESFYDKLGGAAVLNEARRRMSAEYDYVLIDSRTGVSDTSGICTIQMPDALVVCFTLNNQGIEGSAAVGRSVMRQRGEKDASSPSQSRFRVYPVPMRVDTFEKDRLDRRQHFAQQQFADFVSRQDYWGRVEVPYVWYYAYEEVLAAFGDQPGKISTVLGAIERLTEEITNGDVRALLPPTSAERESVLGVFAQTPGESSVPAPPHTWPAAAAAAMLVAVVVAVLLGVGWRAARQMSEQSRVNAVVGYASRALRGDPGSPGTDRVEMREPSPPDPLLAALLLKDLPLDPEPNGARELGLQVLKERFPAIALRTSSPFTSINFSPDGRQLVSGHADGAARVWDATSGGLIRELRGHTGPVQSAAFNSTGVEVVTASQDNTVRVWNGAEARRVISIAALLACAGIESSLRRSNEPVTLLLGDARIVNQDRRLAVAYLTGQLTLFDTADGSCVNRLNPSGAGPPTAPIFSDDAAYAAVLRWNESVVTVFRLEDGHPTQFAMRLTTDAGTVFQIVALDHRATRAVVVRPLDRRGLVVDLPSGQVVSEIVSEQKPPVVFDPSRPVLAGSLVDQPFFSLRQTEFKIQLTPVFASDQKGAPATDDFRLSVPPTAIKFSFDGRQLAAAGQSQSADPAVPLEGIAYVWNLNVTQPGADSSWSAVQAELKNRTRACLGSNQRQQFLGESKEVAEARVVSCQPRPTPAK